MRRPFTSFHPRPAYVAVKASSPSHGSLGSTGPNVGVEFGSGALAIIDADAGGDASIANEPSPDTVAWFQDPDAAVMNVAAGFTTGLSFFYSAPAARSVTVYDGLDATGNVLGTLRLAGNHSANGCVGDPNGFYCNWDPVAGQPADAIETYSGTSGLQYLGDGTWQFNWKTPKTCAGQCRTMTLTLSDGSTHEAAFMFT